MQPSARSLRPAIFLILVIESLTAAVLSSEPRIDQLSARDILDRVDDLYRGDSSRAIMTMKVVSANWARELQMEAWSQGEEESLFRILSPKKERGTATLKSGRQMWNYLPKVKRVIKIPSSMMGRSWMGSHFTNDDLVKETTLLDDYVARLVEPAAADSALYYVELLAREEAPTEWAKILVSVRRHDLMPLEELYFDEGNRPMRRLSFRDIRDFGGKPMPAVIEIVPLHKKGHRTFIRYVEARFDFELDPDVFTLRNLRTRR